MIILRAENLPRSIADPFKWEGILFNRATDKVQLTYWAPSNTDYSVHLANNVATASIIEKVDGHWVTVTIDGRFLGVVNQHHRRRVAGCD